MPTIESLRTAWNQIKSRHAGPYATWTPTQQAGALLSRMSLSAAIAEATGLAGPDGRGYWADVLGLLRGVRADTEGGCS